MNLITNYGLNTSYHEDFFIPGILPSLANSRKQIRQRPKSRIKPCLRPQRKQRLTTRDANFGVFFDLAITDFFAIGDKFFKKEYPSNCFPNRENIGGLLGSKYCFMSSRYTIRISLQCQPKIARLGDFFKFEIVISWRRVF